jgi:hypothetical protein
VTVSGAEGILTDSSSEPERQAIFELVSISGAIGYAVCYTFQKRPDSIAVPGTNVPTIKNGFDFTHVTKIICS